MRGPGRREGVGAARTRGAAGRGEKRRREGTRALCRARGALCPSLVSDGLPHRAHAPPLPRRYTAVPRRRSGRPGPPSRPSPSLWCPLTGSAGESQGFSPAPQARSAGPGLTGPCRCPSRAAWIARRGRAQEGGLARDSVCNRGSVFPWAFRGNPVLVDCRAPGRVVAAAFGPPDSSPLLTLPRAS